MECNNIDDDYTPLTPEQRAAAMDEYELKNTRQHIHNMLNFGCPVDDLTIDEANAVLMALAGVYRARHEDCELNVSIAFRLSVGGPTFEQSCSLPGAPGEERSVGR